MKPFNLEAAKAGAPIITRDGREVKMLLCAEHVGAIKPIVVMIAGDDELSVYYQDGQFFHDEDSCFDLFMKPHKRTIYVNLRFDTQDQCKRRWFEFDEKDIAEKHAKQFRSGMYVAVAVPIEIEE